MFFKYKSPNVILSNVLVQDVHHYHFCTKDLLRLDNNLRKVIKVKNPW